MFHYSPFEQCHYAVPQNVHDQFYSLLNLQREAELQRQRELRKPRVVKKVETEDLYQIQIFKEHGNFNSYEVLVVKKPRNRVHVLITSQEDQFQKVLEFSLNDIEVKKIDWEYYPSEKVLVLNIPKKQPPVEVETRYANPFFNFLEMVQQQQKHEEEQQKKATGQQKAIEYKQRAEFAKQRAHQRKVEAAEKKRETERRRKEFERQEEERIHKEAEAKRREEAKRQAAVERKRQEEERRRAEFLRAKQRAEEELKREQAAAAARQQEQARAAEQARVEARASAEEQAKHSKARAEAQASTDKANGSSVHFNVNNPDEFLQQLFGAMFAAQQQQGVSPQENASNDHAQEPEVEQEPLKPSHTYESDTASIFSEEETETPTGSVPPSPDTSALKLTKQPSLEEVEDEEFVMFRKKFGQ